MRARTALYLSVALILLYWAILIAKLLARPSSPAAPESVQQLAVYVCLKTALVVAIVCALMRASGERLAVWG